jgi:hypothetical protein
MNRLVFALALAVASYSAPPQQQPRRPDSAQEQTKSEPQAPPPTTALSTVATERDPGAHHDEHGATEKRASFWTVTITDVLVALATIAMAFIATLQLIGFNRQGRVVEAHLTAMQASAKAMGSMASSAEDVRVAVTRVENRLVGLTSTMQRKL